MLVYSAPVILTVAVALLSVSAQDAGIPVNLRGVYVNTITQNGPADKAGIHGSTTDQHLKKHLGDVIIAVDGYNITKSDDLALLGHYYYSHITQLYLLLYARAS